MAIEKMKWVEWFRGNGDRESLYRTERHPPPRPDVTTNPMLAAKRTNTPAVHTYELERRTVQVHAPKRIARVSERRDSSKNLF